MRFVILAIILVLLAGFFHIMFIMYDYIWYDNEDGALNILSGKLNESMSQDNQNLSWNRTSILREGFSWGRVICIVMVPVCIGLEAIDKPHITG